MVVDLPVGLGDLEFPDIGGLTIAKHWTVPNLVPRFPSFFRLCGSTTLISRSRKKLASLGTRLDNPLFGVCMSASINHVC